MYPNYPMQKPGSYGVQRMLVATGQIGGTNFLGGTAPLTANQTTIFRMGAPVNRAAFNGFSATAVTAAADPDGTTLAYVYKYDASADAAVQLSDAIDLEALVTREGVTAKVLSSATQDQLTFDTGDALEIHVVNNSAAIGTQPAGLVFVVEMLAVA